MKIKPAVIHFNEHGTPVAQDFDDVYFSNNDGAAETDYVFIEGNRLEERFLACKKSTFIIAETGFGTGLNCARALEAFERFRTKHPTHCLKQLHIVSVEKFPLSAEDLQRALDKQPSTNQYKKLLIQQYPLPLSGTHRMEFPFGIIDLMLGDAVACFESMAENHQGTVDAWFLDGFAPSKNPDMWSDSLFNVMASLSASNATLATFTAAGFVRRGLQASGFAMQKAPGFGKKRDMLVGRMPSISNQASLSNKPPTHVGIIGTGLAGANLAYSLAKRGCRVTLLDKGKIASGASGNPQGGFYPQLHAQVSHPSLIQALSFLFAKRRYESLLASGHDYDHDFCGVLLLAFSEAVKTRQNKMMANAPWPASLVSHIDAAQATQIAGVPLEIGGAFVAKGGWISPPSLVRALIDAASQLAQVDVVEQSQVQRVSVDDANICVTTQNSQYDFDHVVVATGAGEHPFEAVNTLPFGRTRGQVESIPTHDGINALRTVLCHKGYFTPQMNGRHALGSTYVRNSADVDYRVEEAQQNLENHKKALPNAAFLRDIQHDNVGRAATRMTLPDHQPVVGRLAYPDYKRRVSVLCGLGSRGLTTAPLMAEIVASELFNQPLPVQGFLYKALHCERFQK